MKKTVWLGLAVFLWALSPLPSDGAVVVTTTGQKVQLRCGLSIEGWMEWHHRGTMVIRMDGKTGMKQKGKQDISSRATMRSPEALDISGVKKTDAGTFTCKANRKSEEHLLILITVSASPSSTLQLGSSAKLQCEVNGMTPPPKVQWRKPDGSLHSESEITHLNPVARSDAGAWNCTFSYDGKLYGERLDISVKEPAPTAGTSPETSEKPTCKDCEASSPPVSPTVLGLSWWLWVVIGIGCLIVVVLMVFIIYLCKRIQRKKRKLKRMENSRQLLMAKQYCQCNRPAAAPRLQQRRQREKRAAPPLQPLLVQ